MSGKHRVAIIGCGRMGKLHIQGYKQEPRCEVVAVVDILREKAEEFVKTHALSARVFTDHAEMLRAIQPEMVSICLWTRLHLPVIRDCAAAGVPAIHCEKPMAPSWGDARQIARIARGSKSRLTFSHQRRFAPSFSRARDLLRTGEFGALERIEAFNPANILDWGTHIIDLIHMYNNETPVNWVMAQIDARKIGQWFDIKYEHACVASLKFDNGVRAIIHSGDDKEMNLGIRLNCAGGIIEARAEQQLRSLKFCEGKWDETEFANSQGDQAPVAIAGVVKNLVDTLESGQTPAERMLEAWHRRWGGDLAHLYAEESF